VYHLVCQRGHKIKNEIVPEALTVDSSMQLAREMRRVDYSLVLWHRTAAYLIRTDEMSEMTTEVLGLVEDR
jgi:hypothetical protein